MKKIGLFGILIMMLMVACTPAEDNSLPTRVVLPTDNLSVAEATPSIDLIAEATPSIDLIAEATPSIDLIAENTPSIDLIAENTPSIDLIAEATPSIDLIAEATPSIDLIAETTPSIDLITNVTETPTNNPVAPIVIPPSQQTQLPTATPSDGLTVVMPTFDLTNLPTSVPTATPYPVVENFADLTPSTQIVRLRGTIEIFIEPVRDDDIFLLRGADGVAIELLWNFDTIDYIPARTQVVEAIGILETSGTGHSPILMQTQSIIPITQADESGT